MRDMTVLYLPWLLSAITIWMTLLAGSMHRNAWLVGLGNQFLWLVWIVASGSWGFIPLNIALWMVYARNHWKWRVLTMSGIPFVGICSGGPLNGQKMARLESAMEVFAPAYPLAGLVDGDAAPTDELEVCVAGVYEYSGYGLWSWQPTETK